jgi:CHAD domain-containing protein
MMDLTNCNDCRKKIAKFLQKRFKNFGKEFTRIEEEYNCEDIHDSRVSSRIILSMLDTFSPLLPKKELKKVSAHFKKYLKSTSNLRDSQVQNMLALLYKDSFPFVSGFASVMDSYTQLAIYQLGKKIHRLDPQKIKDDFASLVQAINESNLDCMVLLDAINTEIIRNTVFLRDESSRLDINEPTTLHKYRIKLKKLRYLYEVFSFLQTSFSSNFIIELKSAQSLLGQINDLTILESNLQQFVNMQKNRDLIIFGKTANYDMKIFELLKSKMISLFAEFQQKKEFLLDIAKHISR